MHIIFFTHFKTNKGKTKTFLTRTSNRGIVYLVGEKFSVFPYRKEGNAQWPRHIDITCNLRCVCCVLHLFQAINPSIGVVKAILNLTCYCGFAVLCAVNAHF